MADVLVEASLVGDVGAAQLEDALTTQGELERLIANDALRADKGPLATPGVDPVDV